MIAIFLLICLVSCSNTSPGNHSLVVYCGAGLNKAATEIGREFEKKYRIPVHFNFAGSNTLLSQMQLVKSGDVYIPGSAYYLEIANSKGLIQSSQTIALHIPVIAVPAGNPKHITALEHLAKDNIRIALGDPKAAAIGKTAEEILKKNGLEKAVEKNITARTATVNELVVFLSLRQVDAAITWEDNVITTAGKVEIIHIPEDRNIIKSIPAGVLTYSKQKLQARQFIDFLLTGESQNIFRKYGFKPYKEKSSNGNHRL